MKLPHEPGYFPIKCYQREKERQFKSNGFDSSEPSWLVKIIAVLVAAWFIVGGVISLFS